MKTRFKIILFCLTSSSLISCDQLTKGLAKQHLMSREPSSYFHDLFRLQYAENTGAALSLGDNLPQPYSFLLLSLVPLLVLTGLLIYTFTQIKEFNTVRIICYALVFAGGIGNIIDRVFRDRHVTDFMNVGISQLRTGIFNVADLCITAGITGLLFSYYKADKNPKSVNQTI
ncbi:signal peptidase II [Mucilaginibacter terrae]|uniref:signal peptidase II n=1 Tax=Mucilaginibacter terrae TaxID=1955052 RepID=UPI0036254BA6